MLLLVTDWPGGFWFDIESMGLPDKYPAAYTGWCFLASPCLPACAQDEKDEQKVIMVTKSSAPSKTLATTWEYLHPEENCGVQRNLADPKRGLAQSCWFIFETSQELIAGQTLW